MNLSIVPINPMCISKCNARLMFSLVAAVLLAVPGLMAPAAAAAVSAPNSPAGNTGPLTTQQAPIQRVIVADLTDQLHKELQAHDISLLLVLPGGASADGSSMKIKWPALTKVERVDFVHSFEAFMTKWHGFIRHHQHAGSSSDGTAAAAAAAAAVAPAVAAAASLAAGSSTSQGLVTPLTRLQHTAKQTSPSRAAGPSVALLVAGVNGKAGMQQLNLAAAISRRLRHSHSLTLAYSTHSDKGDSLITFSNEAVPLAAAFQATSIFRDAFSAIYDKQVWGPNGGGSGHGSDLAWTKTIRQQLPALITKYNISSMLDSSCGSMHWMPLVLADVAAQQPGFRFMGTDVVCSLIAKHQIKYVDNTNWRFDCIDYSNQPLPSGYDLIFSRDSLQHLPMHGAYMFLNNVRASGARYLLVGSYVTSTDQNGDIAKPGNYYNIDLTKPPFRLAAPLEVVDEATADGKHMLLYDVASMTWQDPLLGLV